MVAEVPITKARAEFADLINRVGYGGERILLTRHGKPLVALVPASALKTEAGSVGEFTSLDLSSRPEGSRSTYAVAAQDSAKPVE